MACYPGLGAPEIPAGEVLLVPLFSNHLAILQRSLEAAGLRQAAAAQNLANVNTPGYKALRVEFEQHLAAALKAGSTTPGLTLKVTHERHRPAGGAGTAAGIQPQLVRDTTRSDRVDGNNVDVEAEMARLAANEVWYGALLRQLNDELTRLRLAITEGRR